MMKICGRICRNLVWSVVILCMLFSVQSFARADQLPDGFILGVDVSELLAQEKSGVVYYDQAGAQA